MRLQSQLWDHFVPVARSEGWIQKIDDLKIHPYTIPNNTSFIHEHRGGREGRPLEGSQKRSKHESVSFLYS